MRNLYFIRHGDVEMPGGQRRCVGASDYPLSALGRLRAVLLAPGFESRELGEVFVSPLSRARETAEIVARALGVPAVSARMGVMRICASTNESSTQITSPSASERRMI